MLLLPCLSQAQTAPSDSINIPDILSHVKFNTGIGYDINAKKIVSTNTIEALGYSAWKLDPTVDVGYASNDKFVVGASFSLIRLKDYGVTIPILDLVEIRPQALYSWGSINLSDVAGSKNSWIFGGSIIKVNF